MPAETTVARPERPMVIDSTTTLALAPGLHWRTWDGEAVVYDTTRGDMHCLDETATALLLRLARLGSRRADALLDAPGPAGADAYADAPGVRLRRLDALRRMAAAGLLVPPDEGSAA